MRAVCYCRYSSDNQRQESITAQLRSIQNYAAKNNIEIIKIYIDEALTATSDEREDFQRMIAELPETKPDFVLVHKLDRFARDRYDAAFYRRAIKKHRARLIAVEQDFGEGPEAELVEGIFEGFAEYFSKNLSREVKKGLLENVMAGMSWGGIPPLGFDFDQNNKFIINETEAEAVRLIFRRKLEGYSYGAIASELKNLGIKSKRGREIGTNSLHDILRNEKYIGTLVYRKTGEKNSRLPDDPNGLIKAVGGCPAIIDEATWYKVQEILDHRKCQPRSRGDISYLLTGYLKCGVCGQAMVGDTSPKKTKEGIVRYGYYKCNLAKRTKECSHSKRYSKILIENRVFENIEKRKDSIKDIELIADKAMDKLLKASGKHDARKTRLKDQVKKLEKELENLQNAIAGGAEAKFLIKKINQVGKQKESLDRELKNIPTISAEVTRQRIIESLRRIKDIKIDRTDDIKCRAAIQENIGEIILSPERFFIKYKFD